MIKSTLIYASLFFSSAEASHPTIRGAKDEKEGSRRGLLTSPIKVTGECTISNFLTAVGNSQATLAQIFGVPNDIEQIQQKLDLSCELATNPTL